MKLGSAAIALVVLLSITACGGNPPQIVDYSPERGAKDVSTALPIRLTFDHDVDMQSVESRLHLVPATDGRPTWINPRQLAYEHPTLAPNTMYQVVLEAGYKDPEGNTALLRHHWSFLTEGPPTLAASAPGNGEAGVDPAAYLVLNFSRNMAGASLSSTITIAPSAPFSVRLDPADGRRAIIAPAALLKSGTTYTIAVASAASDADGNQLASSASITFTTGAVRQLRHWIAFTTASADGTSGALWIVNESGFPRRLFNGAPVSAFGWSPEGDTLLVQGVDGSWSALTPGGDPTPLGFKAAWAAPLSAGQGTVYIDDTGALHRRSPGGADSVIAQAVSAAAVAPGGNRIAFVEARSQSQVIWGYDVGLRARYQLAIEDGPVSDISWSPAGNRIAYLRVDAETTSVKVRNLTGVGATSTVASGTGIGAPAWLPDSVHLVFSATLQSSTGTLRKAFVVSVIAPPAALTAPLGLPADPTVSVANPLPSPDGHQLAFLNDNQVWLMNADGTRPTPLTAYDPVSFPYSVRTPAWTRA